MKTKRSTEYIRLVRHGGHLMLPLPEDIIDTLRLSEGQAVEVESTKSGSFTVNCAVDPLPSLEPLRRFRGLLSNNGTTDIEVSGDDPLLR